MKYAATSPPGFFALVFLTGLSILSLNMFLPSLSNIAAEFQTDYSLVSLSVAGYLGVTGVLQLIIGPFSDRFGRRPVLVFGLIIFILASLGCMLASNIWTFLAFRMMQEVIISGGMLTSIAAVILTEGGGPYQLLGMMLFCSLVALLAAIDVLRVNRRGLRVFGS